MVYVNKFYTFTASALIQAAGAPVYTFSIYASALGSSLGLDQVQLEGVGSMLTVGNFLALISGSAYDQLENCTKLGPRIAIWVGAVLGLIGYGGLYLAATGKLAVSFGGLLALAFIAGNASSWYDTTTIVTNVRNFPNNRGAVVGLLKSFVGLSNSMYASVYSSSLMPSTEAFLGLLTVSVTLLPLLLSAAVNHVPYVETAELHSLTSWLNPETRFMLAYVVVAALAVYQMTSALLEGLGDLPVTGSQQIDLLDLNTAGMFGLLAVMLLVPWRSGGIISRYVHDHLADMEEGEGTLPKFNRQIRSAPSLDVPGLLLLTHHDSSSSLAPAGSSQQQGMLPARLAASAASAASAAAAAAAGHGEGRSAATRSNSDPGRRQTRGPPLATAAAGGAAPARAGLSQLSSSCTPRRLAPDTLEPVMDSCHSGSAAAAAEAPAGNEPAIVAGGAGSTAAVFAAASGSNGASFLDIDTDDDHDGTDEALKQPLLLCHDHLQDLQPDVGQQQQQQQQQQVERPAVLSRASLVSSVTSPNAGTPSQLTVECRHHFTNLSLAQAALTAQFWLLFMLFLAGVGSCLTFLNNLGQINIALGGAAGDHVVFVSLFAVGNAAGRLLMGIIPEHALHTYGTPRTKWLLATSAALTASVLAAAAATAPGQLCLLALSLGLCYGATFTLIPAIAADVFGLRHFAANYSGLQTACAIACYVFPTQLAGFFYGKAVAEHGTGEPCIGRDCYGPTFVVEGVVCLLGCICAAVVLMTTRGVYEQLSQHLQEVEEEEQQDMIDQWQAQRCMLLRTTRAPSDPTISTNTGIPAGQYGQSFHRQCGHAHAALAQLHGSLVAHHQEQQLGQDQGVQAVRPHTAAGLAGSPRTARRLTTPQ